MKTPISACATLVTGVTPDRFEAARDRIVDAASRIDPDGIQHALSCALGLGSATTIHDEVLGPAMRAIGDLWHEGAMTVAQEHLASQYVLGVLIDLLRLAQPSACSVGSRGGCAPVVLTGRARRFERAYVEDHLDSRASLAGA